jgi:Undecaprenyl-phosphate galactose phosphotransferase WbaP
MTQQTKRRICILGMMVADGLAFLLAGLLALGLAVALHKAHWTTLSDVFEFDTRNRIMDFVLGAIVWVLWFHLIKNRYRKRVPFWSEQAEIIKGAFLLALVNLALIALTRNDFSRTVWLAGWLVLIVTLPILRTLSRALLNRARIWQIPTWIIGTGSNAEEACKAIESEWQMGFAVVGLHDLQLGKATPEWSFDQFYDWLQKLAKQTNIRDISFVIALDDGQATVIQHLTQTLSLLGVKSVFIIPDIRGIPLYGADISYFFSHEVLLLRLKNNLESTTAKLVKRAFDIAVGILLSLPALIITALAGLLVVLEDGLPIFYTQERIGQRGKPFKMIKIRSMRKDAGLTLQLWQSKNSPEWQEYLANNNKLKNDPRLLRVGQWIRNLSIDELPQILNVLKGDMSLVGPRPILEAEVEQYGQNITLYNEIRPALTGLWQVSGRSDTSFDQRSNLDAWYIRNWSLGFDIVILLRTVVVLVFRRGAY